MTLFLASCNLLDAATAALEGPSRFARETLAELSLVKSGGSFGPFIPAIDDKNQLLLEAQVEVECPNCGDTYSMELAIGKCEGEQWSAFINENELGNGDRLYVSATAAFLAILGELSHYESHKCLQE